MNSINKGEKILWRELLNTIIIAVAIVIPFRLYIAQPFIVEGASMDPTFKTGQYLIVDEVSYRFSEPERGDIVVFKYPRDTRKYLIKRVIGLPGELVSIKEGQVTVTNPGAPKGLNLWEPYIKYQKNENFTRALGENEYFVMGDNRLGSSDSRIWGPVERKLIVGKPIVRLYPPELLPGETSLSINHN